MILHYKSHKIELTKKKIKHLRLVIYKSGEIKLSSPLRASKSDIMRFLEANLTWLESKISKINKDDKISFLGKRYKLSFDPNLSKISIKNGEIWASNLEEFENFKNKITKKICQKAIEKYSNLLNEKPLKIRYKVMHSRHGSCNFHKKYINLSLNLSQKHYKFIHYVVLHELAHLIHPNHQKSFYQTIENLMPNYKEIVKKFG